MRKLFMLLIVHSSLLTSVAQWQPDVRLTNAPSYSYTSTNNARCVASSGNEVHVVWYDIRDWNYEIYYKRSTDRGISWGADTRLSNDPAASGFPSISLSGLVVHVVWHDNRDGNDEIYYKRSLDGGVNWGGDTRLTNAFDNSWVPSVSTSGSIVHVVWWDMRDGKDEIYYKRSTDTGISWGGDIRLTNNGIFSLYPSLSVSSSLVHVVWYDKRDGNWEIYYKRSTDGGVSWGGDTRLTIDLANSWSPSVSTSSSIVHVVWQDRRDGNWEIYHKRSTDGGISWGSDKRLTNNNFAMSYNPSVLASGLVVHVVWYDHRDGNWETYYKRSPDAGMNWGSDTRLTSNSASSEFPSVSVSDSVVHVVWSDYRDGNYEIYYKRDPTGNIVGIKNVNSELLSEFKLYQNFPNPFNPVTKIEFSLPLPSEGGAQAVQLEIYDVLGRQVAALVSKELEPGSYEVEWDASDFPSGVYFYKLQSGSFTDTRKMILMK